MTLKRTSAHRRDGGRVDPAQDRALAKKKERDMS